MAIHGAAAVIGVAAARSVLVFALSLAFWAAVPAAWGWQPTSVMTASMSPAIQVGDVVVSRPADATALVRGRVVLADDPDHVDRWRLHRVDSIRSDGTLVTKGDANPAPDSSPLRPDAVHGVGFLRVPWVGWPVVWARTGDGTALALTALGVVLCLKVATRRGTEEHDPSDEDDDEAGPVGASTPAPTSTTRRGRRALGLATAVLALSALGSSPAWAALSASTSTGASIAAARLAPPSNVTCRNNVTAEIHWDYSGPDPHGFSLLVDGQVVRSGIPGTDRRASVPADRYYSILTRAEVTVRAEVDPTWTATSARSVTVGGILFGFGRPFCA